MKLLSQNGTICEYETKEHRIKQCRESEHEYKTLEPLISKQKDKNYLKAIA